MGRGHEASKCRIRPIEKRDNPAVAAIIIEVMTEFEAIGPSFSSADTEIQAMYEAYSPSGHAFFVVERADTVLGCGGMGPLAGGAEKVCELRKMYFLPELRGTGMGATLLNVILDSARESGYSLCYLETLERMEDARRLYGKHGFESIDYPMGNTGHSACNFHMVRKLLV
jgi:putative acetyltransferase